MGFDVFYLFGALLGIPASLYAQHLVNKRYPGAPDEPDIFLVIFTAALSWGGLIAVMFFILSLKDGKRGE